MRQHALGLPHINKIIQASNALIPIRSSQVKARGRCGEGKERQWNIIIAVQTTRIGGRKKEKEKKDGVWGVGVGWR